jgi:hypothetical protein
MEQTTRMGLNRTGIQASPIDMEPMRQAAVNGRPTSSGDESQIAALRSNYIAEAEPVGTVPLPGKVKGAIKIAVEKLSGHHPEVLIDKLGERLAFERSGTRLYDALITKYVAAGVSLPTLSIERLREFRNEEAQHLELVAGALTSLGADPTAQTPCADLSGVESLGLMQVVDDPRTTFAQCLHAILVAELADNAGWELLIQLAEDAGKDDMAAGFRAALAQEQEHLAQTRRWHEHSVRGQAG